MLEDTSKRWLDVSIKQTVQWPAAYANEMTWRAQTRVCTALIARMTRTPKILWSLIRILKMTIYNGMSWWLIVSELVCLKMVLLVINSPLRILWIFKCFSWLCCMTNVVLDLHCHMMLFYNDIPKNKSISESTWLKCFISVIRLTSSIIDTNSSMWR